MFFGRMIFVSICLFFLIGCVGIPVPSGVESTNQTLFDSPKDLEERIALLEPGVTKKYIAETVGINDEMPNLEYLDEGSIYTIIFAGAETQGTPDEIEKFRKELLTHNYTGWSLPYKFIKGYGYLEGFHYVTIKKEGFDLRIVFIFENDLLYKRPGIYGVKKIQTTSSSSFVWKALKTVPDRASGLIKF